MTRLFAFEATSTKIEVAIFDILMSSHSSLKSVMQCTNEGAQCVVQKHFCDLLTCSRLRLIESQLPFAPAIKDYFEYTFFLFSSFLSIQSSAVLIVMTDDVTL